MNKKIHIILAALILIASYGFASDENKSFEGFNLQGYSDTGEKAWDVKGDTADVVGTEIKLSNVNANSYGKENINVTAEKGRIDQASGNMQLHNDVVVTGEKGAQLMTDSLYWNRDNDLVSTSDDVMLVDDKVTATGKGMNAKPGLKTAKILKDVAVTVDTQDNDPKKKYVTITSDGPVEIDQVNSRAVFNDNVVAIQEDQTLKADKMEIFFNEKMDDISKIICTGNVFVEQGDNKTYAEKAVYDRATQKLELSGRPKLILVTEGDDSVATFGD